MNNMTKLTALLIVLVMCFTMLASCDWFKKPDNNTNTKEEFTYKGYSTALGTNWNPHTWDTNADQSMLGYLSMPFASMEVKDSVNGVYQWVFEMAESITDVTKDNLDDLTKYGSTIVEGQDYGYVYEFKLNKDAKWENGEAINADTYIESMERLLNSKFRNYRANLYISGESAIAGGAAYYNSEAPIYSPAFDENEAIIEGETYYISLTNDLPYFGYSYRTLMEDYGFIYDDYQPEYVVDENGEPVLDEKGNPVVKVDEKGNTIYAKDENGEKIQIAFGETYYAALEEQVDPYGYIEVTEENVEMINYISLQFLSAFNLGGTPPEFFLPYFYYYISGIGDKVDFDTVGIYKVDDYTFRYVCQTPIDYNYFLTSCTDTWLVYVPLYDELTKPEGVLNVTTYGTSKDTSMSYGIYKLDTYEDQKQVVFTQNENWYGWTEDENGNLVSYTDCINALDSETGELVPFLVDGEAKQQYITTKIVIDVMDESAAKQLFLKGELSEWAPPSAELSQYALSSRLYAVDETYTMSFFFNTDKAALTALDEGANENSVVLTNYNFRKAMSLAINRADYVSVTQGWTPAFSLMNHLYHYDFYNDPTSSYRASEAAMQAIVNLYGVKYGEGELYKTLEEAHAAITGFNLTEAKALFTKACEELVAEGIYTAGEDIVIQIGWAKGALQADDNAQVDKINQYINAALEGTGFGKITFEAIGNIDDRYGDVPAGKYAIGYGAWGGAALYPFRNMQVYCDSDQYDLNEAGCWDPATTMLTLTVNGVEETMSWKDWSNSMIGTGKFANESNEVKLQITAAMEEEYLKFYYRIPLAVTTVCSLLSFQMDYYTDTYNLAYGFGGMRLMSYNYNDAQWAEYCASQPNGTLNYK